MALLKRNIVMKQFYKNQDVDLTPEAKMAK